MHYLFDLFIGNSSHLKVKRNHKKRFKTTAVEKFLTSRKLRRTGSVDLKNADSKGLKFGIKQSTVVGIGIALASLDVFLKNFGKETIIRNEFVYLGSV